MLNKHPTYFSFYYYSGRFSSFSKPSEMGRRTKPLARYEVVSLFPDLPA